MAVETELVCCLYRGPHDQSRSATLHGETHWRENDRDKGKSPFPHIAARQGRGRDSGSRWAEITLLLDCNETGEVTFKLDQPAAILASSVRVKKSRRPIALAFLEGKPHGNSKL